MNNSQVWFCVVMAACGGAGCAASSTYRIPAAEMQRLVALDDGQRGGVVRVMPADQSSKVYAAIPIESVEPPPSAVPVDATPALADPAAPPPNDQTSSAPVEDDSSIDGPGLQINGGGQVDGSVHPRPPVVYVSQGPAPPRPRIAPPMHGGGAGPHGGAGHVGGGHFHGGGGHGGGLHLGGGGHGSGALIALVAAVVVVGAVVAIADSQSEPPPYDGWARIHPDHPLHLSYRSGAQRVIRLRDLRPTDLAGLADTIVKDSDGRVHRLPASSAI